MTITIIIIAVIVAVAIFLALRPRIKAWRYAKDLVFPTAPQRTDLLYGYYACNNGQAAEVADHVNLHFESQFEGQDKAIENILKMARTTILDLSPQLFEKVGDAKVFTLRKNALQDALTFLQQLSKTGALQHVKYIYPIDEPNATVGDLGVLRDAVDIAIAAARQFRELDSVKLAVIYAANSEFIGQQMFDLVGFDDYGMKSHVLTSDRYLQLKDSLRSGQKTIIVPGGAYGQHPKPFLDFANGNAEVGVVMPFIWFDDTTGTAQVKGIRSGPLKDTYIAAGKSAVLKD